MTVAGRMRAAAIVVAVAAIAVPLAPLARAAKQPVPSPTPPTSYSKTSACIRAANIGAVVKNGVSWAQTQLDFTSVWDLGGRGQGQRIAVIDTGVNQVSSFDGRVAGGGDYVVGGGDGLVDCDGHGTLVAGLIAASPDPSTGFAGVAPDAQLMSIRQSSSHYGVKNAKQGSPDQVAGTTTTLAQAIIYATYRGSKIINISEASCRSSATPPDSGGAAIQSAVDYARQHDVVIVAAVGNVDTATDCKRQNTAGKDPQTIPTPADTPGVLAVAAVDRNGQPAPFSLIGSWVGVAAPGVDIMSTNPIAGSSGQIEAFRLPGGRSTVQGTSFAAPYVTGLVALVRARFPSLSAPEVIERIEATAEHPASPGGRNDAVGFGMINPRAALTATLPAEDDTPDARQIRPAVLPVAQSRIDPERSARLVALLGSGGLLVAAVSGAIAAATRRRRMASLARRSTLTPPGRGR